MVSYRSLWATRRHDLPFSPLGIRPPCQSDAPWLKDNAILPQHLQILVPASGCSHILLLPLLGLVVY